MKQSFNTIRNACYCQDTSKANRCTNPNILNNSDELKNNKVEIKVVEVLFL